MTGPVPFRDRRFRIDVGLRFEVDEATERFAAGLERLAGAGTGDGLALLIKAVMVETLLEAYKARFTQRGGQMLNMEYFKGGDDRIQDVTPEEYMTAQRELDEMNRRLQKLEVDSAAYAQLREAMDQRVGRLTKMKIGAGSNTNRGSTGVAKFRLSTGLFHLRAAEVIRKLTENQYLHDTVSKKGERVIGIGRAGLDSIRTPSWTDYQGGQTSSKHNILWRHLEFGTGIHAKPEQRTSGSIYKVGSYWWYGVPGRGLLLKGSRGGHFLRQSTGLPYTSDAANFRLVFAEKMSQTLRGL